MATRAAAPRWRYRAGARACDTARGRWVKGHGARVRRPCGSNMQRNGGKWWNMWWKMWWKTGECWHVNVDLGNCCCWNLLECFLPSWNCRLGQLLWCWVGYTAVYDSEMLGSLGCVKCILGPSWLSWAQKLTRTGSSSGPIKRQQAHSRRLIRGRPKIEGTIKCQLW